jgi:hypothetical protein
MAIKVGAAQLAKIRNAMSRASTKTQAIAKKGEKTVHTLVRTAEISAVSFGLGVAQGRMGTIEVLGVPADLGLGALAHLGGFFGIGGKMSGHLHAVGDGALAAYFVVLGKGTGIGMKEKALGQGSAPKGAAGEKLTAGELEELAK